MAAVPITVPGIGESISEGILSRWLKGEGMLVKAGDWKTAQKIYADAKLSPTYAQWKYRGVLEQRIANAEANVAAFRTSDPKRDGASSRMMFVSTLSCMGCHQD